jgi:biopolymer transport protein ExbB/TolQ|nr:MAG TPA: hypothetical protein [Caudoviricetes sp.]
MNTADLIISIVFICINSTALFLIYRAISRWMIRNEKKIDNLEHAILKIDDYIKYSSHTIDTVYIYALDRLIEQYIKDEKYEVADLVKKDLQLVQANVLKEMKRRMEEVEKKLYEDIINKEYNQKKGETKEE